MNSRLDLHNIYMSFEYEISSATNRGTQTFDGPVIARTYPVPIVPVFSDPAADIALWEIDADKIDDTQLKQVLQNAYASGWTLHPSPWNKDYINISHPEGDHKKIFTNPSGYAPGIIDRSFSYITDVNVGPYLNFRQFGGDWNSTNAGPQSGSSGSAMYDISDAKNSVAGIFFAGSNHLAMISLLENSWRLSDQRGLQNFLDPAQTFISSVPGGYLHDLIPNGQAPFDVHLNANGVYEKDYRLNVTRYFDNNTFKPVGRMKELLFGAGILGSTGDADVYLTVTPRDNAGILLYGVKYNPLTSNATTNFKGTSWKADVPPVNSFPVSFELSSLANSVSGNPSSNIKKLLWEYIRPRVKGDLRGTFENGVRSAVASELAVNVRLSRLNDHLSAISTVRAIKLPDEMPINAVEFFEPGKFAAMWRSGLYRESRGMTSDQLFIDHVTAVGKEISTGNNGGYLNLVNNNYSLGPFKTSTINKDAYLDLSIAVQNKAGGAYFYKVWVDYVPDIDINDYYNFVDDGSVINGFELAAEGQGTGTVSNISVHSRIPTDGELELEHGKNKYYKMRIALSSENNIQQDGVYARGEVEDYQVDVLSSATVANSGVVQELSGLKAEQVLLDQPSLFPNPANGVVNIVVTAAKPGPLKVFILDFTGKTVYLRDISLSGKGRHIIALRDVRLNASTYLLRIVSDDLSWTTKLVIL
ncbi:MAG: T9SS type A sorting domain-containing protein [Bacteroidota bacterium]